MTATTYTVTGMACEHCVHAVTEELTGLGGVSAANVQLVPGGASLVTVNSDTELTQEAVSAALDEAGQYRLAAS